MMGVTAFLRHMVPKKLFHDFLISKVTKAKLMEMFVSLNELKVRLITNLSLVFSLLGYGRVGIRIHQLHLPCDLLPNPLSHKHHTLFQDSNKPEGIKFFSFDATNFLMFSEADYRE